MPDEEWAFRTWLKARPWTNPTWIAMGVPSGAGKFPLVEIVGRIGGGPEDTMPVDRPRLSCNVWGGPGGTGRALAVTARNDLIQFLMDAENIPMDATAVLMTAHSVTALWVPDTTDPANPLPRYVVDATLTVRSA